MEISARDIMTSNPITVSPDTEIAEASRLLLEHRFNGLPVIEKNGTLIGILCQSDLVMQHKRFEIPSFFFLFDGFIPLEFPHKVQERIEKMSALNVGQAMTPSPTVITPDTRLDAIAALMVDGKFHTLPVVEGGKLVGIVGKEDVLRTMLANKLKP